MTEIKGLQETARIASQGFIDRNKKLKEGIEKVKAKRQERTGKPYRQT